MATDLAQFRAAVIAAAQIAVGEMQICMALEATDAINNFEWRWDNVSPNPREITDTGALSESLTASPVNLDANTISYKLTWDPVDPETGRHYAELVHNGATNYFEDENGNTSDYTARPWTFLLMPPEQRDDSDLYTSTGPTVSSLPDDAWEACLIAFRLTMKNELAKTVKVLG